MQAETIVAAILRGEPGAAFLEATDTFPDAGLMSQVVLQLRLTAAVPDRLLEAAGALACPVVDLCGTGGSSGNRLNTSTLAALMAPDLGVAVVKHGGRSASGKVGSLDLLERLGLSLAVLFDNAAESLRTQGLSFLPAGMTYSSFARWAAARKAFGRPTLFNRLGPLLNPVMPTHRLMGAWSPEVAETSAEVLRVLGQRAFVVCSEGDKGFLDEASPFAQTRLWDVSNGGVRQRLLPALETGPAPLAPAFADGVSVALRLLECADDAEAQAGAALVAYNLALVGVLTHGCEGDATIDDDTVFAARVAGAYRGIRATFAARCVRALGRVQYLKAMVPQHAATPVTVACQVDSGGAGAFAKDLSPLACHRDAFQPLRDLHAGAPGWVFAEVKLRTPLRSFGGPSLDDRVAAYVAGGAHAVSVVTHPSFGGSLALLRQVRALTDLPVLAKDFLRQVEEVEALARAGADGILLLEDMVGAAGVAQLADACRRLGVTPFVEGSWTVPDAAAPVGGIPVFNARNLFTLAEGRAYRDGAAFKAARHRPDLRAVLASGADDPVDGALLRQFSRGIIVGSALMRLTNGDAIRDFVRDCVAARPLLKACGAACAADVEAALEAGADLVGVNLVPSSRRVVCEAELAGIVAAAGNWPRRLVFVTASDSPRALLERALRCAAFEQPYGVPMLPGSLGMLVPSSVADHLGMRLRVLDGPGPGSGVAYDYAANHRGDGAPVLASGGVRPENAGLRMAAARSAGWAVAGVDAATGVEGLHGPGRFDPAKIRALRQAVDAASGKG
jgi:anthranilate phosphoribosyltransferase